MDAFLIVVMIVGGWNLVNLVARIFYKEMSYAYTYHIAIGLWAAYLYFCR